LAPRHNPDVDQTLCRENRLVSGRWRSKYLLFPPHARRTSRLAARNSIIESKEGKRPRFAQILQLGLESILSNIISCSIGQTPYLACLHDQNKSGFLEGRLLYNQSELFNTF